MEKKVHKIAVLTGAAGGIGSAIAKLLVKNNLVDYIILLDINEGKLDELYQKLGKASCIIPKYCDVGDFQSVDNVLSALEKSIGSPNILINNAGIGGPFHRIDEVSEEEWLQVINTNLKSVFNFSKILLPKMKLIGFGRIVNIASIQGYLGAALSSTYVASKHGVIGYTKAIAAEWSRYGITCNAICPGYVNTTMGVQEEKVANHYEAIINRTPAGRVASPEEVASLVGYLLGAEASFINGSVLTIDGGLTCHVGVS